LRPTEDSLHIDHAISPRIPLLSSSFILLRDFEQDGRTPRVSQRPSRLCVIFFRQFPLHPFLADPRTTANSCASLVLCYIATGGPSYTSISHGQNTPPDQRRRPKTRNPRSVRRTSQLLRRKDSPRITERSRVRETPRQ